MIDKEYFKIKKLTAYSAVLFWLLCWITPEADKLIKGLGVSLPWLSIFVSIPFMIFLDPESKREASIVTYSYVVCTVLYVIIVSVLRMNYINQVPHLACCVSVISAGALHDIMKDFEKEKQLTY